MLLSQHYPLIEDLGFPEGVRAGRQRWVDKARKDQARARWGAIGAAIALTFAFATLGLLPWMIQRAVQPQRLNSQMTSNMPHGNAHLGAEYYNIASALVDGRGFADPFVVESGPTAWMPPLLVWIQAGLIYLFGGDRYLVMLAVCTLKTLLLAGCGAAIVYHGRRWNSGWVAMGVFGAFILAEFGDCFSFTHDSWLILGSVTATVFGLAAIERRARSGGLSMGLAIAWGLVGGLVALSSPVAGFAWATGTAVVLILRAPVQLLLAAVGSIAVVTPWMIRNQLVFDKFIPVKSNVFFEFDQSMALDSDGLLDWRTMSSHPYHAGPERDAYVEMGEIAYLETKKQRFLEQIDSQPELFKQKIKNRLMAITLLPAGFSSYSNPSLTLPLRWLIYPWPAVAVVGLCLFGRPLSALQRSAIVIYIAYLTPYVICSYYPRYGFPLLAVKILLCYWMIQRGTVLVRHVRARME